MDSNNIPPSEGEPDDIPAEDELRDIVFGPSSSEIAAAEAIFRDGLIPAAQAIVHVASFGSTERTRLDAAKYVVERNLGKVVEKIKDKDKWESLLEEITQKHA